MHNTGANLETYHVTLTGRTSLLMHADNLEWQEKVDLWREHNGLADPTARDKGAKKKGDDRSPAWLWIGSLHHDGEHIAVPSDYIAACGMQGGAMLNVPGAKSANKTFKAQSQSGMMSTEPFWKLVVGKSTIPITPIHELIEEPNFACHAKTVSALGFSLFSKRAKVGAGKHVRVRPRFENWKCSGDIVVIDPDITGDILLQFYTLAGRYKGIGDWRPGSPKAPGQFGMFTATVERA